MNGRDKEKKIGIRRNREFEEPEWKKNRVTPTINKFGKNCFILIKKRKKTKWN